jgi:hypothetical protein
MVAIGVAAALFGAGGARSSDGTSISSDVLFGLAAAVLTGVVLVPGVPRMRRLRAEGRPPMRPPSRSARREGLTVLVILVAGAAVSAALGALTTILVILGIGAATQLILLLVWCLPARRPVSD